MVTTSAFANWSVVITTFNGVGRELGFNTLSHVQNMTPLDAFDYAIQAQGYFRFAIQEMEASSLTIDVLNEAGRGVETIRITRD
jgi:hypothetical protein